MISEMPQAVVQGGLQGETAAIAGDIAGLRQSSGASQASRAQADGYMMGTMGSAERAPWAWIRQVIVKHACTWSFNSPCRSLQRRQCRVLPCKRCPPLRCRCLAWSYTGHTDSVCPHWCYGVCECPVGWQTSVASHSLPFKFEARIGCSAVPKSADGPCLRPCLAQRAVAISLQGGAILSPASLDAQALSAWL